jgi:galactonate dehydratase
LGERVLKCPWVVKDGYIDLPTAPGLGVEIDEDAVEQRYEGNFDNDTWYSERDGSVTDW